MTSATSLSFVPDARIEAAPKLPLHRPPTRAEVWKHYHAIYFDLKGHKANGLCDVRCCRKDEGDLEQQCAEMWAWLYVNALRNGWDKQPDWKEGDEVKTVSVPTNAYKEFTVSNTYQWPTLLRLYMRRGGDKT